MDRCTGTFCQIWRKQDAFLESVACTLEFIPKTLNEYMILI